MKQIKIKRHTFEGLKEEIIKVGSDCFIGYCGSGHTVFGENGKVTKISNNYVYCTSESGSIVKWNIERRRVAGKWDKNFYFVNFNMTRTYCTPGHQTECIKSRPSVWNDKTLELEYK